ncbi:alanine racemase [Clostridium collagenovorans DSM 3089]|uniref:Alanine racemase n=1 Tax=Clostridium collagenovorans DSM 3089 TaxID=1121306 RepID=A0A1M5WXZ0_9CLOT|nr:alanine racemase [Clostridium collagenovorans]SHH92178.1 alanine racemase [Clostridium collagenovorans DSM 3089]
MFRHLRPVWAEINLDNLAHNIREIKKIVPDKEIMAVVKADAYGHGALDTVPTLLENGADRLAVAVLTEGIELRRSGIQCPIMVLGFTQPELIDEILRFDIEPSVYSYEFANQLSRMAMRKNKIAKIHIGVDTGMGRIGYLPTEDSIKEILQIHNLPNIKIESIFSHFSSADEADKAYTNLQAERYNWFLEKLKEEGMSTPKRNLANSAAIIDMSEYQYEIVRPGIILYGYYPSKEVKYERLNIKPVMSTKTNIVHIKTIKSGEFIGYGRQFKVEKESIIATLPVGYADGMSRLLSGKAKVLIKGQFAPVVGRICMDQCMVDVTDLKDVKFGDEVILIGEDGNNKITADEIGELLGTISYEVVCVVGKRVPRVYIKDGKITKIRNYI